VLVAIVLLVSATVKTAFRYCIKNRRGRRLWSHMHSMIGTSLLIFYLMYLFVSTTALEMLNCSEIISVDGTSDGKLYLSAQPDVECYAEGSMQTRMYPLAIGFFFFYSVGYPVVLGLILIPGGNASKAKEDQVLRARGLGDTREENRNCYEFRKKYSKLYYKFKPDQHYWMLIIVARKFSISVSALLFRANATFQLCMILLVMFAGYALQVRHQPYMSMSERDWVVAQDEARMLLENEGEVANFVKARQQKMNKIKLGEHGSKHLINRRVGSKASNYIWNYNNVEAVLLGCAVLVNLFGIMFESDFLQRETSQLELLTYATLGVICGSLIYYMLVVWCELFVALWPNKRCFGCGQEKEREEDKTEFVDNRKGDDIGKITEEVNRKAKTRQSVFHMMANPVSRASGASAEELNEKWGFGGRKGGEGAVERELMTVRETLQKVMAENRNLKREIGANKMTAAVNKVTAVGKVKKNKFFALGASESGGAQSFGGASVDSGDGRQREDTVTFFTEKHNVAAPVTVPVPGARDEEGKATKRTVESTDSLKKSIGWATAMNAQSSNKLSATNLGTAGGGGARRGPKKKTYEAPGGAGGSSGGLKALNKSSSVKNPMARHHHIGDDSL